MSITVSQSLWCKEVIGRFHYLIVLFSRSLPSPYGEYTIIILLCFQQQEEKATNLKYVRLSVLFNKVRALEKLFTQNQLWCHFIRGEWPRWEGYQLQSSLTILMHSREKDLKMEMHWWIPWSKDWLQDPRVAPLPPHCCPHITPTVSISFSIVCHVQMKPKYSR